MDTIPLNYANASPGKLIVVDADGLMSPSPTRLADLATQSQLAAISLTPGVPGPQGAVGAMGPMGPQGPIGLTGAVGGTGFTGAMGPQGPAGAIGGTGLTGATGAIGPQGPAGAAGAKGDAGVAGPAGSQGIAGPAGAAGATGPAGPGLAAGGTTAQVARKASNADYAVEWHTLVPVDVGATVTPTIDAIVQRDGTGAINVSGLSMGESVPTPDGSGVTQTSASGGLADTYYTYNLVAVRNGNYSDTYSIFDDNVGGSITFSNLPEPPAGTTYFIVRYNDDTGITAIIGTVTGRTFTDSGLPDGDTWLGASSPVVLQPVRGGGDVLTTTGGVTLGYVTAGSGNFTNLSVSNSIFFSGSADCYMTNATIRPKALSINNYNSGAGQVELIGAYSYYATYIRASIGTYNDSNYRTEWTYEVASRTTSIGTFSANYPIVMRGNEIRTLGKWVCNYNTSTTYDVKQGGFYAQWVDNTHATRRSRLTFFAADWTAAEREGFRVESDGARAYAVYPANAAPPPDAMIYNGSFAFYTDGANLLVKFRTSAGTLKSGTLALA